MKDTKDTAEALTLPPEVMEALEVLAKLTGYSKQLAASVAIASYLEKLREEYRRDAV